MTQFCSSLVNTVSNCATGFQTQNHEYGKVSEKLKLSADNSKPMQFIFCSNQISGIKSWN